MLPHEGMGPHPVEVIAWRNIHQHTEGGVLRAEHLVPVEQFAHFIDQAGSCLCGPELNTVIDLDTGMPYAMIGHHSLDGRFYRDFPGRDDWGPDGPVSSPGPVHSRVK